jgi:hypothetical protein
VADNQHRYGFRWHKGQYNCVPKGEVFHVADAYQAQVDGAGASVDLNIGDPVRMVTGGSVALANTAIPVYGIVVGVHRIFEPATGYTRPADRVPGGTTSGGNLDRATLVEVVPAKGVIWEIDVDDNVTHTTEAGYRSYIHRNVEHVCTGDFSVAGRPKADPRIDISAASLTPTSGALLGWRIVGVSKTAHNKDFSGLNVKMLVKVNDSQEAGSTATPVDPV